MILLKRLQLLNTAEMPRKHGQSHVPRGFQRFAEMLNRKWSRIMDRYRSPLIRYLEALSKDDMAELVESAEAYKRHLRYFSPLDTDPKKFKLLSNLAIKFFADISDIPIVCNEIYRVAAIRYCTENKD